MIAANVYHGVRGEVIRVWLRDCPQTGDIMWLNPSTQPPPGAGVRIVRVEHVCDGAWKPDLNIGGSPPHSLIIYVEPR
jgi:hypothetical protein